ncbi:hypothetical protein ACIBKY_21975 [Nonomuraea sp. NPDC050394]|uniref:hypothetical protein n=1 Tax=Nonomuraea sp. NPDC050394 TaxID=3364363 RepID=UPI003791BEC2
MVASLVERVTQAKSTAQQHVHELRNQLAVAEGQLQRLTHALEVMMEFTDDQPDEAELSAEDAVAAEGEPTDLAGDIPEEPASPLPPLRGFRRQVVALLATSDEPMRAREVVQAIGKPDTRSQVEGMRSRLQRLVSDGWLRRDDGGLYAIATGINGHAPREEAD